MKRVLFVLTEQNTGGIVSSLRNLLQTIDSSVYSIDVLFLIGNKRNNSSFPNCTVLKSSYFLELLLCHLRHKRGLGKLIAVTLKLLDKATGRLLQKFLFSRKAKSLLKRKYESVVAFSEGLPTYFVSNMRHEKKIAWIHCNYKSYLVINNGVNELSVYNSFQYIVNVSKFTQSCFIDCYPSLAGRCVYIYNILNEASIIQQSENPLSDMVLSKFSIVSVGRIDPVKRFRIIPKIVRDIINQGCTLKWYIIGPQGNSSEEYNELIRNIKEYGVEDEVILLGERSNPYNYISKAELLVSTSESEACPYVINEAKIVGTPIVCTNFGSAKEFVQEGVTGYVVPVERLAETIVKLIKDKTLYNEIKQNVVEYRYDNEKILNSIYNLL